jgi:hypothetical protein
MKRFSTLRNELCGLTEATVKSKHSVAFVISILKGDLAVVDATKGKRWGSNPYADTANDTITWTKASKKFTPENILKAFTAKGYKVYDKDKTGIIFDMNGNSRERVEVDYAKNKETMTPMFFVRVTTPKNAKMSSLPYYD